MCLIVDVSSDANVFVSDNPRPHFVTSHRKHAPPIVDQKAPYSTKVSHRLGNVPFSLFFTSQWKSYRAKVKKTHISRVSSQTLMFLFGVWSRCAEKSEWKKRVKCNNVFTLSHVLLCPFKSEHFRYRTFSGKLENCALIHIFSLRYLQTSPPSTFLPFRFQYLLN